MKLKNLNEPIKSMDGKIVKNDNKDVTVAYILANLAAMGFKDAKPLQSVRLYQLATRLYEAKNELDVNAESIEDLKRCYEANLAQYTPFVLGQVLLKSELEK